MLSFKKESLIKLWIIPPLVIGVVVVMIARGSKSEPNLAEVKEVAHSVRTMVVESQDFTPIATGYGTVQPKQSWKAISQVSARIVSMHENLSNGSYVKKGDVLVTLDPVDYELNLVNAEVKLAEIDVSEKNTKASLAIENRNLILAEKEFKRLSSLAKKGTSSKSAADSAERSMLSTRSAVQNYKNSLALFPTQKKTQQTIITQAQRDLDNTTIVAPYDMNVSGLDIEANQYVSKGQQLFVGDSIDTVEIVTYVSLSELKNLFFKREDLNTNLESLVNNLSSVAQFTPTVYLDLGGERKASWDAKFVRFTDEVDAQTRTMGVVVAVDDPLQKIIAGVRPPLSKGMLVEVAIQGAVQNDMLVVPQSAIHNNAVYVLNEENRLSVKSITLYYNQDGMSLIRTGIESGSQIVLSDIIPAIDGMLLHVNNDDDILLSTQ